MGVDHSELMESSMILAVDDQMSNRILLREFIGMLGYGCLLAGDGMEAMDILASHPVDLVLLDIMMPLMDGYAAMGLEPALRRIPVVVISGMDDMQSIIRCIEQGADDYMTKPFDPFLLRARIHSSLSKKWLIDQDVIQRARIEKYNSELMTLVAEQVREISSTQLATIFAMSCLAESRDLETGENLERMRIYALLLANAIYRDEPLPDGSRALLVDSIYSAAPLHDIGKVGVPDRILQKPGRLDPLEFDIMKTHCAIGAETLRQVDRIHPGNSFIQVGIEIAHHHHERWDGAGYPDGLAGEAIPMPARILAVADVYDAMTSKRCYKEAMSHEESRVAIIEGAGTQFDPRVVTAFMGLEDEFVDIRRRLQDSGK